jgi:hypothetical protein
LIRQIEVASLEARCAPPVALHPEAHLAVQPAQDDLPGAITDEAEFVFLFF